MAKWGRVLVSLVEVTEALAVLGLTIDGLHQAIDQGEYDRDQHSSQFNPPTDPGIRAHGTTVRALRETYVRKGWNFCDHQNFSTLVSSDSAMAIAIASGDEATGDPNRVPRTKHQKGESVVLGVERNRQIPLFRLPPVIRMDRHTAAMTWILLRNRRGQIVRCELSIPTSLGEDKRAIFEGTRIILPDLVLGPRGGVKSRDDEPVEPSIDVTVLRRKA